MQHSLEEKKALIAAIIRGNLGNGVERRRKVEAMGFDFAQIQDQVNRNLAAGTTRVGDITWHGELPITETNNYHTSTIPEAVSVPETSNVNQNSEMHYNAGEGTVLNTEPVTDAYQTEPIITNSSEGYNQGTTEAYTGSYTQGTGSGQGAEISELRKQLQTLFEGGSSFAQEMKGIITHLAEMAQTINIQSDMGRGLSHLSEQSTNLANQGIADLNEIMEFLDNRITTAEAENINSAESLNSLANELNDSTSGYNGVYNEAGIANTNYYQTEEAYTSYNQGYNNEVGIEPLVTNIEYMGESYTNYEGIIANNVYPEITTVASTITPFPLPEPRLVNGNYHFDINGTTFVKSQDLNPGRQGITVEQAARLFNELPPYMQNAVNEIRLLDTRNPWDGHWAAQYGIANFQSFATGGNGRIQFYQNNRRHTSDRFVQDMMVHEIAHNLDQQMGRHLGGNRNSEFSSKPNGTWAQAVALDLANNGRRAPTQYGLVHPREDFADSLKLFHRNEASFRQNFPNRAAAIDEVLNAARSW